MKKRIIASILALVMTVLALVSCGAGFNFAEDSDDYVTVDLAGLKAALAAVEIEDADFTTNEATRLEKVKYNLYTTLTDAAVKEADKQTVGSLTGRDVLYFCYYAGLDTDDDGTDDYYFFTNQMKATAITSGTTTEKAKHVIELAVVANDEDDKYGNALYAALIEAIEAAGGSIELKNDATDEAEKVNKLYNTNTTKSTAVSAGDTIFISYTRKPVVANDASDDDIAAAKEEKVLYEMIVLDKDKYADGSSNDALVELILGEGMTATVGNDVSKSTTTGEGDEATTSTQTKFELTVDGKAYTYSEIGIEWKVTENNGPLVSFKYTPYTTTNKVEPDNLHETDADKIELKDKELTYYVYPVNYIAVPELNSTTILKEILGDDIAADSVKVFEDEEYKNGEDTIKALVEKLVKLWADDEDVLADFTNEAGDKTLAQLKQAIEDAEAAHDEAEDDEEHDHDALEKVVTEAEEAYDEAKEYAIDAQIAKILASKKTVDGSEVTADATVWEQYAGKGGVVYNTLKTEYDNAIVDAVGAAVWELIDEYVKVNDYPEEMVEEFYDHLYESYEYKFYKENDSTSKQSNYLEYDGDLEKYLLAATDASEHNNSYVEAITAEAKEYLKPLLQIYALSTALANDAESKVTETMKSYVELDKAGGAYDVLDDDLDEDEKKEQEEAAKESYEKALADSESFIVTDDVFKAYKKELGNATYRAWEEQYGEINIRAALQSNRLMYYLLSTNVQINADGDAIEVKYETVDGVDYIDFRTVSYVIKADTEDAEEDAE